MQSGAEFETWPGDIAPTVGQRVHIFDRNLEFTQHEVLRVDGRRVWVGPAIPFEQTPEEHPALPVRWSDEPVYRNLDHVLNESVVDQLLSDPGRGAEHTAWNFCGYVWRGPDGRWFEQVWRFNAPVETRSGDDLAELIAGVNDDYGDD
jgi:hypothetical protein